MRSFGIVVVLLLWFLILYKTCEDRKKCCSDTLIGAALPINTIEKDCPVCFKWQGNQPQLCDNWNSFRDSLVASVSNNQYLEIKGFYITNEIENGADLALQRAKSVSSLFTTSFAKESIRVVSDVKNNRSKQACSAMVEFSVKTDVEVAIPDRELVAVNTEKIKISGDKALVYFPYNSSNKISDSEIEQYLNDLAQQLRSTKNRIRIIGHTDAQGASNDNLMLGQKRADMIGRYLMKRGVTKSQIITISRGESKPIADNNTDSGRASNRRTELKIIQN